MKAVIQVVRAASVTVNEELVSSIKRGLCVLIGIHKDDTADDMEYIVRKILNTKFFAEPSTGQKWKQSVKDANLEVLSISQFTLYSIMKGNKLDFHAAMGGDAAKNFYYDFLSSMKKSYDDEKIKDGQFGALMQVHIENDGPITINLDSRNR